MRPIVSTTTHKNEQRLHIQRNNKKYIVRWFPCLSIMRVDYSLRYKTRPASSIDDICSKLDDVERQLDDRQDYPSRCADELRDAAYDKVLFDLP